MTRLPTALLLAAFAGAAVAGGDFELYALVDSLDFATNYDIETPRGTLQTLEHVLRAYPTTVLWRDKGGGLMRYPSAEEWSEYAENPLDKRQIWRRSIYGDLRQHNLATNVFRLVRAECERRRLGFGIHTTWEENHWLAGTESNWTMAHPGMTSRTRRGPVRLASGSLGFEECRRHKLALVDERLAMRPAVVFLDLERSGGWSPTAEYTEPVIRRWRALYGCEPPADGDDERWRQLVWEFARDYLTEFGRRCHAQGTRFLLGITHLDKDADRCWRTLAIDWKSLARDGVIDGLVAMDVDFKASDPLGSTRANLEYARQHCGSAKLYHQVSVYDQIARYAAALDTSVPDATTALIEVSQAAGCAGAIMECVDHGNYTDAICDRLAAVSPAASGPVFRWTGQPGADWSAASAWNRAAAPDDPSSVVEFRVPSALTLGSTNDVSAVLARNDCRSVTLEPSGAGALRFNFGGTAVVGKDGVTVDAGAVLGVNVPVFVRGRFDRWGYGELRLGAVLTGDSQGPVVLSSFGTNVISRGGGVRLPGETLIVGNGAGELACGCLRIEGDGFVEARGLSLSGGKTCSANAVVQEGAASSVRVTSLSLNASSVLARQDYILRAGTLEAKTLATSGQDALPGGWLRQTGGSASFETVELVHGGVLLSDGEMTVTREVRAGGDGAFAAEGGVLTLAAGTKVSAPIAVSNATLVVGGALSWSGDGRIVLAGETTVRLTGDAAFDSRHWQNRPGVRLHLEAGTPRTVSVDEDWQLPDVLEVGANVTVGVALGAQLTARTSEPPELAIRRGGHLDFAGQTAALATPVDLSVETGGQLWVDAPAGRYARTAVVARRYRIDGVEQPLGAYPAASDEGAVFRGKVTSTLHVPHVWTGGGDGRSWQDAANWRDGRVPGPSRTEMADLSSATGTVVLASNVVLGAIAYLPPNGDGVLRLAAAADGVRLSLFGEDRDWRTAALCRRGCRLEFDVGFLYPRDGGNSCWNGGGTYRFLRSVENAFDRSFVLDGTVELAGASPPAGNLTFYSNHHADSRIRILGGASVSLDGTVTTEVSGFICGRGYEQTGGDVVASNLCLTVGRPDGRTYNRYVLDGGTLTLAGELMLGGTNPLGLNAGGVYDTGSFVMNGGTLRVERISNELNSNECRLLGGDVWLGAGGFVRSVSPRAADGDVPNVSAPIALGNVTLHAEDVSWRSAGELSVELLGRTVLNVGAGREIALEGPVSGRGGLEKRGAGTLTLGGAWEAEGVLRASGGRLVLSAGSRLSAASEIDARGARVAFLGAVDGGLGVLQVDALADVSVAADLTVGSLTVGGVVRPAGRYAVDGGTLTVAVPDGAFAWTGGSGGSWNEGANWLDGRLPDGASTVDFGYSALVSNHVLYLDAAASLSGLVYRTTLEDGRLELRGAGPLTLADGAVLTVQEGRELVLSCEVRAKGRVVKRGGGRAVFAGRLRSERDPASLAFGEGASVCVAEGEAVFANEVEGTHVYPCSDRRDAGAQVTVGEGAVLTNRAWVTGTWCPTARTVYGRVVQDGGTVDVTSATLALFGSTGIQSASGACQQANKHCFSWFRAGESSYTLNGGTHRMSAAGTFCCLNLNNTNAGGGRSTLTVNGGLLSVDGTVFAGTQNDECDEIAVRGGDVRIATLAAGSGTGGNCVRRLVLEGGSLTVGGWTAGALMDFLVTGETRLGQVSADSTFDLPPGASGVGRLVQAGPGTLRVGDTSFAGGFKVAGGTLDVASGARWSVPNAVAVDGGRLRFLGEADVRSLALDVPSLDDVSVEEPCEVAVRRLAFAGVDAPVGAYPAGRGVLRALKDAGEELALAAGAPDLDWFAAGDRAWLADDGAAAIRSGAIIAGEESVAGVRFGGKGTFSFDWRASSEEKYDAVRLTVDGVTVRHLSGETDWQRVTLDLPPGPHEVRWSYQKNRSVSAGLDAAWVARVTWTVDPPPSLAEALNVGCALAWRTGGDADWEAFHTPSAREGGSCAVSGAIGDLGVSWLETSVPDGGRLEFAWAASCERFDWCEFTVDGEPVAELSGVTDWIPQTLDLDEGEHVLRWEYWKDSEDDPDADWADCVLLDCVRFTPQADVIGTDFGTVAVSAFYDWLKAFRRVEEPAVPLTRAARRTLTAAKARETGDKGLPLAAEFVAGTDPNDRESTFAATIEMVGGRPVVRWNPALNGVDADGRCVREGVRLYRLLGSDDLSTWSDVPEGQESLYRFFKVSVSLPGDPPLSLQSKGTE